MSALFRKGYRPGDVARWAAESGQLDHGTSRHVLPELLQRREEAERQRIINAGAAGMLRRTEKVERLSRLLDRRKAKRQEQIDRLAPRTDRANTWRRAGILERIPLVEFSRTTKITIIGLLAMLDFYVFARSVAVNQDVPERLTEPQFLIGGGYGLLVFVVGFFLARSLKQWNYASAQRRLRREIDQGAVEVPDEDLRLLVPSRVDPSVLFVFLLMFGAFCVAGVFVRMGGAAVDEGLGLAMLQALVPVLVVLAEFFLFDPTDYRLPKPNSIDRWLEQQRDRDEQRRITIEEATLRMLDNVEAMYGIERSLLDVQPNDRS
ncbi:MAG: hypothetical protein S0880_30840 [Actinomycetota bacterium]|nr:hypothetical protein [Actinomycetota bacterium]